MDFDGPSLALDRALQSLRTEQEHSDFFQAVLDTNADFLEWPGRTKKKKALDTRYIFHELALMSRP